MTVFPPPATPPPPPPPPPQHHPPHPPPPPPPARRAGAQGQQPARGRLPAERVEQRRVLARRIEAGDPGDRRQIDRQRDPRGEEPGSLHHHQRDRVTRCGRRRAVQREREEKPGDHGEQDSRENDAAISGL